MFCLYTSEMRDLLKSAPLSALSVHRARSSASRVTSGRKFKAIVAMTCQPTGVYWPRPVTKSAFCYKPDLLERMWTCGNRIPLPRASSDIEVRFLIYFPYLKKNKRRLMRSPCCLCGYVSPLTPERRKVKVTLRPTISRSVHHGVEPHLGLMTRY
jgi:hypothetical protein